MKKLALITGASAGIGAAFARAYAQRGIDVALTARRGDRLDALAAELRAKHKVEVLTHAADLAKAGAAEEIVSAMGRPVDVLVNNAGYGLAGAFRSAAWEDQAAFIQVLATAPAELAYRVLPAMVDAKWGRIINVASLAGLAPGAQGHTLYAAVKAFLIKFSQSLHLEVADKGVHVTALCPGFTISEFHDVAGTRGQVSKVPKPFWQTAEAVVEEAIKANAANKAVYVPGAANKALATIARLIPDEIGLAVMSRGAKSFRNAD
jgi:uncharacterized protein